MGKRSQQRHTGMTLEQRIRRSEKRKAREEMERKKREKDVAKALAQVLTAGVTLIPKEKP